MKLTLVRLFTAFVLCAAAASCSDPQDTGSVSKLCATDSDCGEGYKCRPADGGGVCEKEGADLCADGRGKCNGLCCPAGRICVEGVCILEEQCPEENKCGEVCCDDSSECVLNRCLPKCATRVRCGEDLSACCGDGQACEFGRCVAVCGERPRCGGNDELCCQEGEVCWDRKCALPGDPCGTTHDCGADEICEPTLGRCLPRIEAGGECEYRPPPGQFDPYMECAWRGSLVDPARDDVVMTPAVANLTDDNGDGVIDAADIPDIAFLSYDLEGDGCCNVSATLRVVSGRCSDDGTMREHLSVNTFDFDNSSSIAIGDIDGDGSPDIVLMILGGGTVAIERDGTTKWQSPDPAGDDTLRAAQPAIANIDAAGPAEILAGRVVLDGATGQTLWKGRGGRGINSFLGPISIASDINLDGFLEVIAGNTAYDRMGNALWTYQFGNEGTGCKGRMGCDGFNAAGNFDDDDEGEVVIVREGNVYVIEHTGELKRRIPIPHDDCEYNEGGPPTVADFDGDGRAEIGVAAADFYTVFDLDCEPPFPEGCAGEGILWSVPNQDCSSRVTGSSVFDFEADGVAEVIYNDEKLFRIFSGPDGRILFEWENHSHTRLEYPVIVDVDNDGNAEIVFIENRSGNGPESGIEIWGDRSDNWVRTRRIWNQHSYHITNIEENAAVPVQEKTNWLEPGLNNFRQNVQGENVFDAPDLVATDIRASRESCPPKLLIAITVSNRGNIGVMAGVKVSVFLHSEAGDELAGTAETARDLFPGASEIVVLEWEVPEELLEARLSFTAKVDDDGTGAGANNECDETNNGVGPSSEVMCKIP